MKELKEAHQTILEVYSILINIKPDNDKWAMYNAIRAAVSKIEEQTTRALGRAEDNT